MNFPDRILFSDGIGKSLINPIGSGGVWIRATNLKFNSEFTPEKLPKPNI